MYAECGFGNESLCSTELRNEVRVKGFFVATFISVYVRIWIGKIVVILDSREGVKVQKKNRCSFKCLFGIVSE